MARLRLLGLLFIGFFGSANASFTVSCDDGCSGAPASDRTANLLIVNDDADSITLKWQTGLTPDPDRPFLMVAGNPMTSDTLVNLVEDTEASHTNEGSVDKSNSTSITSPTFFGQGVSFNNPFSSNPYNLGQSLQSDTSFSGDGENTQNNEFSGSLSVTVTDVLSNGYLRVRGEKRIGMTGGNEYIRVSGIVRPEDIDVQNTVDSTRIADATLVYVGDGQVTDASKMGWLARFFISAVFPF